MFNTHKSLNPVLGPEIHSRQRTGCLLYLQVTCQRCTLSTALQARLAHITSFQSIHGLPVNHPHSHVTVFPHSCCSLKGQTLAVCCSGIFQGPNTRTSPKPHFQNTVLDKTKGKPWADWNSQKWFCAICWACHRPSLATQEKGLQKSRHIKSGCPQWSGKLPISSLLSYGTSYKPSEGRYQD